MTVITGVLASLVAPLLEAVGFLEWDIHWKKGGGSAFALNLYKCNLAALGFYLVAKIVSNQQNGDMFYVGEHRRLQPSDQNLAYQQQLWIDHERLINPKQIGMIEQQLMMEKELLGGYQNGPQTFQQQQQQQQQQQHQQPFDFNPPLYPQRPIDDHSAQNMILPQQQDFYQRDENNQQGINMVHPQEEQFQYPSKPLNYDANFQYQSPEVQEQWYNNHRDEHPETSVTSFEKVSQQLMNNRDTSSLWTWAVVGPLLLSSTLAILIGDMAELEALRLVGARRVLVVDTVKPFAAAFWGSKVLGEELRPPAFLGMVLTAIGVSIVLRASIARIETRQKKRLRRLRSSRLDISERSERSTGNGKTHSMQPISPLPPPQDLKHFYEMSVMESNGNGTSMHEEDDGAKDTVPLRRPLSRHDLEYDDFVLKNTIDDSSDDFDDYQTCHESSGTLYSWIEMDEDLDDEDDDFSDIGNAKKYDDADFLRRKDENGSDNGSETSEEDFFIEPESPPSPVRSQPTGLPMGTDDDDMPSMPDIGKKNAEPKPSLENINVVHQDKNSNDLLRRQSSMGEYGSQSSFLSEESECGPPPGYYNRRERKRERTYRLQLGYSLALLNVVLDAYGSLLTKQYGAALNTWEIGFIRYGFAGLIFLIVSIAMRIRDAFCAEGRSRRKTTVKFPKTTTGVTSDPASVPWYLLPQMATDPWVTVSVGVIFVTFLCPALTNYALFEIALGLAVTLSSTTPLYTIPLMYIMKKERPTRRGSIGAIIACLGVIVLCLWGIDAENLVD